MRTSSQLREQDWLLPDSSLHILLARTATGKISPSCSFPSIGFLAQQNASISGSDPDTQFRYLVVMTILCDLCPGPSLEDRSKEENKRGHGCHSNGWNKAQGQWLKRSHGISPHSARGSEFEVLM